MQETSISKCKLLKEKKRKKDDLVRVKKRKKRSHFLKTPSSNTLKDSYATLVQSARSVHSLKPKELKFEKKEEKKEQFLNIHKASTCT